MFRNVLLALALLATIAPGYARAQTTSGGQAAIAACNESKTLWSTYVSQTHWPGEARSYQGTLFVTWTDQNLPLWFPIRLRTDSWNAVVPNIYERYSGQNMVVKMRREPFKESCDAAGNLSVSFFAEFRWFAENNGVYSQLFDTDISGHLRPLRVANGPIVAEIMGSPAPHFIQNYIAGFDIHRLTFYELFLMLNNRWCVRGGGGGPPC